MSNAIKNDTTFRMEIAVSIEIDAPRERVWSLLTDGATLAAWNSTVQSVDGAIAEGETIRLVATVDPKRVFKLKVSDVVENEGMVWSDGFAPMFRGQRSYRLVALDGGGTRFEMVEVFSGLMLPMIKGSLPDFAPIFETYAADLKRAAEA